MNVPNCPFCNTPNFIISTPAHQVFRASYGCTKCSAYVLADTIEEATKIWKQSARNTPRSIDRVRQFHEAFGHPVKSTPDGGDRALRILRVKLIAEELGELCEALGVDLTLKAGLFFQHAGQSKCEVTCEIDSVDLVEAADALGDLDYVVQGSNLVFGFPAGEVLEEIHRANMSKLGANGKPIYREDGKVIKGPNYAPPNIKRIVFRPVPAPPPAAPTPIKAGEPGYMTYY